MTDSQRKTLKEGQRIKLSTRPDGSAPDQYLIRSVINAGASTVCYEAVRERDGQTGKLKEFYPIDSVVGDQSYYYSLERLENGQLVPRGGTKRYFSERCDEYIKTYRRLNSVIAENRQNQILKNFIQIGEILYGTMEKEKTPSNLLAKFFKIGTEENIKPTVYVWSLGVEGEVFADYLAEVRKNPYKNGDKRLHDILAVMITLTDCIKSLHTIGMLHLDIKPENFLVLYDGEFKLNTASISMFDIGTLYHMSDDTFKTAGTKGFNAPDFQKGKIDNRTDIYSIGAMLFYALVVVDDIPDGIYKDSYYGDIDQLVRRSKLMAGTESVENFPLMTKVAKILKKCLAQKRECRYGSCSELKNDLEQAEMYAKPYAVSTRVVGGNKRLAIIDKEPKEVKDQVVVMQKLLYEHPLYENLDYNQKQINVLVVGSSSYGQKFIDLCLQAGQMKDRHINITAISDNPEEDRESYLQFRPAISRFVNIDGSMAGKEDIAYGSIEFRGLENGETDKDLEFRNANGAAEENKALASRIITEGKETGIVYDYVFVALGNDRLSYRVAKLFSELIAESGEQNRCPVCYVAENSKRALKKELDSMLYPVFVNEKIVIKDIDRNLEQMAFNADICWNSSLNLDLTDAFDEFRKNRYRYKSSIAYALTIPYKLYSIGIALRSDLKNPEKYASFSLVDNSVEAAEAFSKQVLERKDSDPEAKEKFDTLVALEHRRWVLSLVAEGWTAPYDEKGELNLETCIIEGVVKNEIKQTHPALVFSSVSSPLKEEEYTSHARAKWDDPNIDETLDELDRMSIELHQRFRASAEEYKRKPSHTEDMSKIWEMLDKSHVESVRMYKQFQFCIKNVLNGVESYTRQYGYYEKKFTDSLVTLQKSTKEKIQERLNLIRKELFPVIEANLYKNYKAVDDTLVEKIPFILTFDFHSSIATAFEDGRLQNGRNEAVFTNVAAATVLSPKKISYLYRFDRDSKVEQIQKKLSAVLNYLGHRKVHCSVLFTVVCMADTDDRSKEKLRKALERLKRSHSANALNNVEFSHYRFLCPRSIPEAAGALIDLLKADEVSLYDGSTQLFSSIFDNCGFIDMVTKAEIPYFEFDWRRKQFIKHIGCDYLQFIKDKSSLRINDMFALMNASDTRFNLPEFADDYELLWDIYSGRLTGRPFSKAVGNWNRLCYALKKYEEAQKPLAVLGIPSGDGSKKKELGYILPEYTFKTVNSILRKLIEFGIADSKSTLTAHTSENCKLEIIVDESLEEKLNSVFRKPQILQDFYGISVDKDYAGKDVQINYVNMEVVNANIDIEGNGNTNFSCEILKKLEENHFINGFSVNKKDPRLVSFRYTSSRIKHLLTVAGEILEIYTYYQVLKTGYFDDVACGYEFCWENGEVKNELDIVLTKGFRSIIAECKAVQQLDLIYYHKLHSIAEHFGIGTIKVLIGNTYRNNDNAINSANRMQRTRGEQLGIKTISNEKQLVNIGETLIKLMEEE